MATGETPGTRDQGGGISTHVKSMGYWSAPRLPGGRMSHRSGGNRMAYIVTSFSPAFPDPVTESARRNRRETLSPAGTSRSSTRYSSANPDRPVASSVYRNRTCAYSASRIFPPSFFPAGSYENSIAIPSRTTLSGARPETLSAAEPYRANPHNARNKTRTVRKFNRRSAVFLFTDAPRC